MKFWSLILIILALCVNSGHTNTDSSSAEIFPRSWDTGDVLKDKHVLAWVQYKGHIRTLWCLQGRIRNCFVVEIKHDSMGKSSYTLSQYISYPGVWAGWALNYDFKLVPRAENSGSNIIFVDHIKSYHQPPDSSEVYSLLHAWGFTFNPDGQTTVSAVNSSLWKQVLGWEADKTMLMKP